MRKTAFAVADEAPTANTLTDYDEEHFIIYRDLLEAERHTIVCYNGRRQTQ